MEKCSIVPKTPIILGVILLFLNTSNAGRHDGVQCNGYCTDDIQHCKNLGGRIMGYCTNSLACCDPLIHSKFAKCGDVKSEQKIVHMKSPSYPSFSSGDLSCTVKIDILKDNVATRVDFIHAEMDGPSFSESENESGQCESDLVFFRGFQTWAPPPRCGNLSGYSFLIDGDTPQTKDMKSLTILFLMASQQYRWHIRVIQLLKTKKFYPNQNSVYDADTPIFNKGKRSLLNPLPSLDLDPVESGRMESFAKPDDPTDDKKKSKSVLNGEDTLISQVPWQVSFRYKLESLNADEVNDKLNSNCSIREGFHFCGGSIISENLLLTASHCFYGTSKTNGMVDLAFAKAVVGDTNLCTDSEADPPSFDYDIESVTMHYGYDSNLLINDIAIVKLKTRIQFKEYIKPITLAKTGDDFSETSALLSGWGDYLKLKPMEEEETDVDRESSTSLPLNNTIGESFVNLTTSTSTTISPETTTEIIAEMDPLQNETITTPLFEENPSELTTPTLASTTTTTVPTQNASAIEEETFVLETPSILQSSRRFLIQNRSVCNAKDIEQYSTTKENVLKYVKYTSVLDSTLCTMSGDGSDYKPVSTGKGDSGGGLVVYQFKNGGKEPVQVGVVSYGVADSESETSCVSNSKSPNGTFDFFSSIAFYRGWIDLVILSHENYSHID